MYQAFLCKEFDLMTQLDHQNIVHFLSMENIPNLGTAIVMEYIDGVTLKEFLATNPDDKLRHKIIFELLDAMAYMHSKQIIHRDLKPSNILITNNCCNVKVIDFGLADGDDYTIFKSSAGTLKYASPEQLNPDWKIDSRTDIYSFGKILELVFPLINWNFIKIDEYSSFI
jgi:serine/threonine protein kinase